jgi:hypothetical protein
VCVLSSGGDLANTENACTLPLNVEGAGETSNCWQTHSVRNTPLLAQVERDGPLSILIICSVVPASAVITSVAEPEPQGAA